MASDDDLTWTPTSVCDGLRSDGGFPTWSPSSILCAMPLVVDVTSLDATFSKSGRATLMSQNTELQRNYELNAPPSKEVSITWTCLLHIALVRIVFKSSQNFSAKLRTHTNGVGRHLFSNNNFIMDVEWMATPTSRKGTEGRSPARAPTGQESIQQHDAPAVCAPCTPCMPGEIVVVWSQKRVASTDSRVWRT